MKTKVYQAWLASSVLFSMLGMGMIVGFTSNLLRALQAADSPIQISSEASSWIVASIGISNMVGYFISSVLMYPLGRRFTYLIGLLPAFAGIVITVTATEVTTLMWGRILSGITLGATGPLGAVVIGEYCSPEYRGMFLNLKTAGFFVGSLVVHLLGFAFHWRTVALINITPYVLALVVAYNWPESPSWLAQKKRFSESREVFFKIRGFTKDSQREIEELIKAQKNNHKKCITEAVMEFFKKFTKKNFLKPIFIYVFAAILLESAGRHIYPAYAMQIIIEITGEDSNTIYYALAADAIITSSAMVSSYLVKIMKLRTLLFSTGISSCFALILAVSYLFLVSRHYISKDYSMVPICIFGIYFFLVNLGCTPIPLALMGELYPLEHRAVGASISGYLISILMTIALKIVPPMILAFEIYGMFAILALCTSLSLTVLYFTLPETKNRTLQEIEDFYNRGWFRNDNRPEIEEEPLQLREELHTGLGHRHKASVPS